MKLASVLLLTVALSGSAFAADWPNPIYSNLAAFQTQAEVRASLGNPHWLSCDHDVCAWHYLVSPTEELAVYFSGDFVVRWDDYVPLVGAARFAAAPARTQDWASLAPSQTKDQVRANLGVPDSVTCDEHAIVCAWRYADNGGDWTLNFDKGGMVDWNWQAAGAQYEGPPAVTPAQRLRRGQQRVRESGAQPATVSSAAAVEYNAIGSTANTAAEPKIGLTKMQKLKRILGIAADVMAVAAVATACAQLENKPIIMLTANDVRAIQQCRAAGF